MRDHKNDEGAFPVEIGGWGKPSRGMSLRDYFAAKAMNAILLQDEIGIQANRPTGHYDAGVSETCAELWARNAYEIADAMLKARDA
jgi:hypothetical protein